MSEKKTRYECWIIRIDSYGQREFWKRCSGFPGCQQKADLCKNQWCEIPEKDKEKLKQKRLF
jgi:hypothetical protein